MDEFIEFLRSMGIEQVMIGTEEPEPDAADIAVAAMEFMYPHFPTGKRCENPDCGCEGRGMAMAPSIFN